MRVDRLRRQQFAGGIDHGNFATGANPRVDPHGHVLAGRCGQQQILEVLAENANRFLFGAFA